jgi:hypothetical protein
MTHWLQYIALKVGVLSVLLTATTLFAIRYPALLGGSSLYMRWAWVPIETLNVLRIVLPVLLAFGWFVYFMAAKRLGRPQ